MQRLGRLRDAGLGVAGLLGVARLLDQVLDFVASGIALFGGFIPGMPLNRDQWIMLQKDNVADGGASGFKAFGITPTPLAAVAPEWLGRYKTGGRFAPRTA